MMRDLPISPKEAIEMQRRLAEEVRIEPLQEDIHAIAGADVSLERFGTELFAGVIVLSYPALVPLCHAVVKTSTDFPYIPGLLSFREAPGLLKCFDMLPIRPDAVIVDGQGIAHPRRLGIASHLGILTGIPMIGCAKSPLFGAYEEPEDVGDHADVRDPKTGERIGFALKSKARANPLIVSPGHLVGFDDALDAVKSCLRGYRLPEPTRLAHALVNGFREGNIEKGAKLY